MSGIVKPAMAWTVAAALWAGCADGVIGDPATGPDAGEPDGGSSVQQEPDAAPAPDAPPPDATPCQGGDDQSVGENGHCYVLFSDPSATWQEAAEACEMLGSGAHLATVTDPAEDALIIELAGPGDVWLGGNDLAVEGSWEWITGEPMQHDNWGTGEPNDSGGEDCMIMRLVGTDNDPNYNVGTWDDRPCSKTYGFVCERP